MHCFIDSPDSRKDRYNKKIHKYYVVYGEEDDELSEDEEKNETCDHEVWGRFMLFPWFPISLHASSAEVASWRAKFRQTHPLPQVGEDVTFKRLGAVTEGSESEEDLDEDEKKAEQINTAKKENVIGLNWMWNQKLSCQWCVFTSLVDIFPYVGFKQHIIISAIFSTNLVQFTIPMAL